MFAFKSKISSVKKNQDKQIIMMIFQKQGLKFRDLLNVHNR